jgi:hypothetical protein
MSAQAAFVLMMVGQLATVTAEDHLRPSEGVLTVREAPAYELALARAFFPSDENRYAQFVAVPSGAPERAVYIRETDSGGFEVVSIQLEANLWGEMMAILLPPGKPQSPINGQTISAALAKVAAKPERRTARLDATTARALSDTWNAAIDQVRYGKKGPTNDGISYYFADGTAQFRAGWIWTPAANTRMAALVSLGEMLFSYGWDEAGRDKVKPKLLAGASRLKAKLRVVAGRSR